MAGQRRRELDDGMASVVEIISQLRRLGAPKPLLDDLLLKFSRLESESEERWDALTPQQRKTLMMRRAIRAAARAGAPNDDRGHP